MSQELTITWGSPAENTPFRTASAGGILIVAKADGGAVTLTSIPVTGAQADFMGANGNYSGQLLLTGLDGTKTYVAGWSMPGPSATLHLEKDTTPPGVEVIVEPRPLALGDAEPGSESYWKKDEAALVRVTVDGGRPAQAGDLVTAWGGAVSTASCSASCLGNCRCFSVDLAGSTVSGIRGVAAVQVTAISDTVGNLSAGQDAGIQVTRFKWTRAIPGAATRLLPVAVSRAGLVVAGVDESPTTTNSIRLVATAQDGGTAWSAAVTGTITAGPVIGANDIWVATNSGANSQLQPIGLSTGGGGAIQCFASSGPPYGGDLALSSLNSGTIEVPLGVRNGEVQGPSVGNCRATPLSSPAPMDVTSRASLVVRTPDGGTTESFIVYEGDSRLWKSELTGASWADRGNALLPSGTQPRGLFLDGTGIVGGGGGVVGNGAVFATDAGGTFSGSTGFSSVNAANAGPPAVGNGFLLFGNTAGDLVKVSYVVGALSGSTSAAAGVGNLQASTPLIGVGGLAYLVGASGNLTVRRTSDLSELWGGTLVSLTGAGNVSQPALDVYRGSAGAKDCNKPLGILYVTTRSGAAATLRAILVDSKGLDGNAPWPKFQRDNANTGNSSLGLGPWICP